MKTCEIGPERVEDFIGFSWKVHSGDRTWIPPMRSTMRRELERKEDRVLFLCEDGGEVVGRVAASTHPEMNPVGMVGHFESIEDNEIGASLFTAAEEWLRKLAEKLLTEEEKAKIAGGNAARIYHLN